MTLWICIAWAVVLALAIGMALAVVALTRRTGRLREAWRIRRAKERQYREELGNTYVSLRLDDVARRDSGGVFRPRRKGIDAGNPSAVPFSLRWMVEANPSSFLNEHERWRLFAAELDAESGIEVDSPESVVCVLKFLAQNKSELLDQAVSYAKTSGWSFKAEEASFPYRLLKAVHADGDSIDLARVEATYDAMTGTLQYVGDFGLSRALGLDEKGGNSGTCSSASG